VAEGQPAGWEQGCLVQLVAGDQTALAGLYDRYSALVYGVAARVTGDRTAAEEITQDVFTYIWENPGVFDPDRGSLRSWFCMLAHRRAVDRIRRERVRSRGDLRSAQSGPPSPDVEGDAISAAFAGRIRSAVADLPAAQRAAITLAYFDGLSYREVAQALDIPEGTAKSRMRLGLRRLADVLRAEGITP
jgi:RNA polymerase sigma factor (sigma-70 family)